MEKRRREFTKQPKCNGESLPSNTEQNTIQPRNRNMQLSMNVEKIVRGVRTTKVSSMQLPPKNRRTFNKFGKQPQVQIQYDQYGNPYDQYGNPIEQTQDNNIQEYDTDSQI